MYQVANLGVVPSRYVVKMSDIREDAIWTGNNDYQSCCFSLDKKCKYEKLFWVDIKNKKLPQATSFS